MSINSETFSLQTSININDVPYEIMVSGNKLDGQERQIITLMKDTDGVKIVRSKMLLEDPEFLLTGEGLMVDANDEELKIFAFDWILDVEEKVDPEEIFSLGLLKLIDHQFFPAYDF